MGVQRQVEYMAAWFHNLFEDPANETPYESREGGYQYVWGGPYEAEEELREEFEGVASEEAIEAAVEEVERGGILEWAPSSNHPDQVNARESLQNDDAELSAQSMESEMDSELTEHENIKGGPRERISDLLRRALEMKSISQRELAQQTGISPSQFSRWYNRKGELSAANLERIQEFLGVQVEASVTARSSSDETAEELKEVAQSIPDQSPLVRFGVSENAKLNLIPTLADENDYDTIEAFRSELLAAEGPIDHLKERYASNPNVPQAYLFAPLTSKYDDELSKDPKHINYAILYARGARFYAARRRAAEQVASGDWPELDAKESEAIDAICDLHGPLIMASAVGRKVVEDAHQYEVPPDVYARDREVVEELSQVITAEPGLMEAEDAEAYREIVAGPGGDPQPARTRTIQLAVTGSALVAIVGGVAWLSAGGGAAAVAVPLVAGYGASKFLWEVAKKTDVFRRVTDDLASRYDSATYQASKEASRRHLALLQQMKELVERNPELFERVANIRPEFGWTRRYLKVPKSENSAKGNNKTKIPEGTKLHLHLVVIGPRGSGKTTIGKLLAERLKVPFRNLEYKLTERMEDNPARLRERLGERAFLGEAQRAFEKLLGEPPSVIELDTLSAQYEEFWDIPTGRVLPITLKVDRDLLPSEDAEVTPPANRISLKFNVSNSTPEEITERIIDRLVGQTDALFPGGP